MDNELKPGDGVQDRLRKNSEEWNRTALAGDEPFTDGVTPEILAARESQRQAREAAAARDRARAEKRAQLLADTPLKVLRKQLNMMSFSGGLSESENQRTRQLLNAPNARAMRRGVGITLIRYAQAQVYAGGHLIILAMKSNHWSVASDVFRIADMARVLFWKYRKPGFLGVPVSDEDLNYSLKRTEHDLQHNPEIVALLEEFKKVLLDQGIFSESPVSPHRRARLVKHFRTSTVMARMDEVTARMDEMAKQLNDILAENKALALRMSTLEGKTI